MNAMNLMNRTWDEVQVALAHDPVLTRLWAQLTDCSIKSCGLNRYSEYFEYIGNGSFKEAYIYTSPISGERLIVKLCSEDNDTIEEARIQDAVLDEGVAGFVPTIYLPVSPEMNYLEQEVEEEDEDGEWFTNWITPACDFVEVQPIVEVLGEMGEINRHHLYGAQLCRRIPALNGLKYFPINNTQWLRDYSNAYGAEMMAKFVNFVTNQGIYDLHSGNIGYFGGLPVIFDWLS